MTDLEVRRPEFDFTDDVPFAGTRRNPRSRSAMNTISIMAIGFEQMIVAAVTEAKPLITDPAVAEEAAAFLARRPSTRARTAST